MESIKFRCNKYTPVVLYMLLIFGVAFGFSVYYGILLFSGIAKGPEYAPAYFREHSDHAIWLIFGLIPVAMLLPAWIAAKCWGSREEEAQLKLYEDYAVLYWKNKEVYMQKGELRIKIPKPHPHWYKVYILKVPGQRLVLVSSVKEAKEKRGLRLSLDMAMDKLSAYRKLKKGERKKEKVIDFYGITIVPGHTTPAVFEDSPYYADYKNMVRIEGMPFVSCMLRERKNPVHVVGDMGIDIRFLEGSDYDEMKLKRQAILEIIELDEEVEE